MVLMKFIRYRRMITLGILPVFLLCSIITPALAQKRTDGEIQATNIRWKTLGDIITINYDLVAPPNEAYQVSVFMKRESDSAFTFTPVSIEGDVGKGYFSGTYREIRWNYRADYDERIQGDDYYFEVQVKSIGSIKKWLYYALGAAAVTGGLIVILASGGGNGGTNPVVELPMPPARP